MEIAVYLYQIGCVVAGAFYMFLMHRNIYTDVLRTPLINADGEPETILVEKHVNAAHRLVTANLSWLYYLEMALAIVSVVCSLLLLFGVKSDAVKKIQIISSVLALAGFIAVLVIAGGNTPKY